MAEGDSGSPPTTPSSKPAGRKKALVLAIVAVVIVAAVASVVYVLVTRSPGTPSPEVIGLDHVTVTAQGGTAAVDQGGSLLLDAAAVDTKGTDVTSAAHINWSASPSSAVSIIPTGVSYRVQILGLLAGPVSVTANVTHNTTSKQGSLSLTVAPVHFEITASVAVAEVGVPFLVTVAALHADSSPAEGYLGTVHFTSNDTAASLPGDYTYIIINHGSHGFSVSLSRAGLVRISAQDTRASISADLSILGNHAPVAQMTATPNARDPREVTVDGTTSTDADGDALTYSWNFGDGSPRATTSVAAHRYAAAGGYTIFLTVTDEHGASDTASQSYYANAPPIAAFTMRPMQALGSDFNATADASSSSDPDGSIVAYGWSWGDGNTSAVAGPITNHTYAASYDGQNVTIRLTVTDNGSVSNTTSRIVRVTLQQFPPVVDFTVTVDQNIRTVSVDAAPSWDPNGNIAYYNWTWGDGAYLNSTSPTANHTYPDNGDYVLNLTIGDTTDLRGWKERLLTIAQPGLPPVARFVVTRTLMHVDLNASTSSDPNGDIATYSWDTNNDGTPDASGVTAAFDYSTPGTYTIKLTVTDATAKTSNATKKVSVGTSTLDYSFSDFFNVPYGEWWDMRSATYGDTPINADCFNATSVADRICTPTNASLPDHESYPYTNWYPLPGDLSWALPNNNPMVYAPYRFRATGVNVPGYNRSEPVFLPVLNYSQPAGNRLDFDWKMQYLDNATGTALTAAGCPGVDPAAYDGFFLRNQITLTMDLQESKRIFGVVATDQASAQAWWTANTNPLCALQGTVETNVRNWFLKMAGGSASGTGVGKYDIANSYEWYYTSYYMQITATVDADGTTHVFIDHAATGTEVLLARMFYWGNASYIQNYLDSSKARGWWGMELAWFEDFNFSGNLGAPGAGFDFNLSTVMQYHFQAQSDPGPNRLYDRTDDVPYWSWGPILSDYTNDYFAAHPASELDRYPSATYVHSTPGGRTYGLSLIYDYAPIRWDLLAGQTWHFQFPKGDVVFYDPNRTPKPANPQGGFVSVSGPLKYFGSAPASYGYWDSANLTWDVYGPASTGGPPGTPGPDGVPGTADDQYALSPWGAIQVGDPPAGPSLNSALPRMTVASADAGPALASTGFPVLLSAGNTWAVPGDSAPGATPRRSRP